MISLFMKDHHIIDVRSKDDLKRIKRKDIEFYRVPINSNNFNENACVFLENTKLLYNFEGGSVNALVTAYKGPEDLCMIPECTFDLPRFDRTFTGLEEFESFISYIFSFKRFQMVNSGLYDARAYDVDMLNNEAVGFALVDICIDVKYSGREEPLIIIKQNYVSNDTSDDCFEGEINSTGLQYAIVTIDDFLELHHSYGELEVGSLYRAHDKEPMIRVGGDGLVPYRLYSPNLKYTVLNKKGTKWEYKKYKDIDWNDKYYIDLMMSDTCVPISIELPILLESVIEMVYYEVYYCNYTDSINLDTDISYDSFSTYAFEKLTFTVSSIWYLKILTDLVFSHKKEVEPYVASKVTITFRNNETMSLNITDNSTNVLDTIIEIARYKEGNMI